MWLFLRKKRQFKIIIQANQHYFVRPWVTRNLKYYKDFLTKYILPTMSSANKKKNTYICSRTLNMSKQSTLWMFLECLNDVHLWTGSASISCHSSVFHCVTMALKTMRLTALSLASLRATNSLFKSSLPSVSASRGLALSFIRLPAMGC